MVTVGGLKRLAIDITPVILSLICDMNFTSYLIDCILHHHHGAQSMDLNPLPPGKGEISLPHSRAIFSKLKNEDKDFFSFRNCKK